MRRLRGVIFDMDGVLVDSHAVHRMGLALSFSRRWDRKASELEPHFLFWMAASRSRYFETFLGNCSDLASSRTWGWLER